VRVGSRSTAVVIEHAVSPVAFVSAILLYVGGAYCAFGLRSGLRITNQGISEKVKKIPEPLSAPSVQVRLLARLTAGEKPPDS
jgi:hypothetical protein